MKWEVFTDEERTHIEKLVASGDFASIAKCISLDTPEKEYWLDQYLADLRPIVENIDSKVREEIKGVSIDSPDKEKEWQAKIDAEKEEHKSKVLSAKEKRAAEKAAKDEAALIAEKARVEKSIIDTEAQIKSEAKARAIAALTKAK